MKVNRVCRFVLLTLTAVLLFGLVACAPQGSITEGFINSIPDMDESSYVEPVTSEDDVSVQEGHAAPPEITAVLNVTPQQLVITGTCDEGCDVTITDGVHEVTVGSIEGHFVMEYNITTTTFVILSATAKSDTLETSEVTTFRAEYSSTAMKRTDNLGVTVGANSHFYYDSALASYKGVDTLLTQTQIRNFKTFVDTKVKNFKNRGGSNDVSLVYVLVPNAITLNNDFLAAGTEKDTYKTRYEQVVEALGETNALCLDMTDIFVAAQNNGEKVYYNTDNHLTEYGGYLVYSAICDMMDEKFPEAAARSLENDFTSVTSLMNGGNLARNLGVDPAVVQETATFYTPKFSLNIGSEDEAIGTAGARIKNFDKYADESSIELATDLNTAAARLLFATNRKNLPCALIYRDDFATTFFDILAERFNRVLLAKVGDFTINMTDAQRYYGVNGTTGANNTTVDYIFIIVSESNLGSILS